MSVCKPLYKWQSDPADEEEAVDINRELIVEKNSKINMQPISRLSAVDYLKKLKCTL